MDRSLAEVSTTVQEEFLGIPTDTHPEWTTVRDLRQLRSHGAHTEQMALLSDIMNVATAEFRRCGIHNIHPEHIVHYAIAIVRGREHFSLSCVREHVEYVLGHIGSVACDDVAIEHLASAYANAHRADLSLASVT